MFWGITLRAGKRYRQMVEQSFHISMAAVEPKLSAASKKRASPRGPRLASVMAQHDKAEFLLCTLESGCVNQQPLDLNFTEGENITFYVNGEGVVHLTGFLHQAEGLGLSDEESKQDSEEESDEDYDDSEDEASKSKKFKCEECEKAYIGRAGLGRHYLLSGHGEVEDIPIEPELHVRASRRIKKPLSYEDEDEDEEDEEDEAVSVQSASSKSKEKATADSESESDDEADEGKGSPGSVKRKKKDDTKLASKKLRKDEPESDEPDGDDSDSDDSDQVNGVNQESKKKKNKKNKDQKPTKLRVVGGGGTTVQDLKEGHGPPVKPGKMVHVYYTGKILSSGKTFDSCLTGKPFKFKLGKAEVVKGWDLGVAGMKVGGKRKIIVTPKHGYGSQKLAKIPPNSTLVFDVELKSVT